MTALRALRPRSRSAKRDPFAGFVCDEATRAVLAEIAAQRSWPDTLIRNGGIGEALSVLPSIPTPELLIVDVSESPDPVTETGNLAYVCDENTRAIVLGTVNDVHLFRALVEIGADDYLLKPVTAEALAESIDKVLEPPVVEHAAEEQEGRIVTVIGSRGGIGATSVAVSGAWLAANDLDMQVALVDLDLHFGTVALSLDIEPGRGFGEALESPNRIDALFLERAVVRAGKNLAVLGSERTLDEASKLSAATIDPLVERLRDDFDAVVFDLPRGTATAIPELLMASDCIVLVSDLSLAGMRDTLRLSDFIKAKAPNSEIRIVVNRQDGKAKKGEMSPDEFERNSELKIAAALPEDLKSAVKAAESGRPVAAVAPKGRFATTLRGLVPALMGVEGAAKPSLWRRLSGKAS